MGVDRSKSRLAMKIRLKVKSVLFKIIVLGMDYCQARNIVLRHLFFDRSRAGRLARLYAPLSGHPSHSLRSGTGFTLGLKPSCARIALSASKVSD
jgi:hypothetical protein